MYILSFINIYDFIFDLNFSYIALNRANWRTQGICVCHRIYESKEFLCSTEKP